MKIPWRLFKISGFFVLLTGIFTYPLFLHLNRYFPASATTDEAYAALWDFWWHGFSWHNGPFSFSCFPIAMPFGMSSCESAYLLWNFINKVLSVLTNNVFTYNFEIVFSFVAAGVSMYYLAFFVTKNRWASIFSAVTFTFCPYHFARAWQHLGLAQIQWLPVYVLSLLKLRELPSARNIIFAGFAFFLVASFDFYYAYFMILVSGVFVVFLFGSKLVQGKEKKGGIQNELKSLRALFFALTLALVLMLPSIRVVLKNKPTFVAAEAKAYDSYNRPFEDLFDQSARPLSYFLPAFDHPVLGSFTGSFLGSSLYGSSLTEHALYLGWAPLLCAFIVFKRRRFDFQSGFFIFLAAAAWFISQPPWWNILGLKIPMPSFFLYKIFPMFRAYCRFGIILSLAVAVLAGLGFRAILLSGSKRRLVTAAILSFFLLFEFWNWPSYKVVDVSLVPQVYSWIKAQPGDLLIAEYPLDAKAPRELYKYLQTKHEKRIINGTIPGTYANKVAQRIVALSDPVSAGILKGLGVTYAIVHHKGYKDTEILADSEELQKIPLNPGLKLIKNFPAQECPSKDIPCLYEPDFTSLYEVVADALPIEIEKR